MDIKEEKEVAQTAVAAAAEATWPQTRAILRVVMVVLAVAAVLWMFYALEGVLLLLVLAIFFAYLIAPLIEFVQRPFHIRGRQRIMPRTAAVAIVYVVLFGTLGLTLYFLWPQLYNQISEFIKQAPGYLQSGKARMDGWNRLLNRYPLPPAINEAIQNAGARAAESVSAGLSSVLGWVIYLPWLLLIPILALFLLKDIESFRRSALQMLPTGRWRWRGDEFFQDVNTTLAAYIRAQLTACLLIGFICTIGFYLIGVPYWLGLGIIAGLLEFIPLVGPLTVAVLVTVISSFHSSREVVIVLLFLGILRILQDYVFYPRIIGQGIHLHPLAVILSILCGAELAGIAGIFLAIPAIAIATVSYRHWLEHRGSEGLVADILKPSEPEVKAVASDAPTPALPAAKEVAQASAEQDHPNLNTTVEQMVRARPDLTTGELKLPRAD